jgi:hypothetical protein
VIRRGGSDSTLSRLEFFQDTGGGLSKAMVKGVGFRIRGISLHLYIQDHVDQGKLTGKRNKSRVRRNFGEEDDDDGLRRSSI